MLKIALSLCVCMALFNNTSVFAMGEDMTDQEWDAYIQECPYGDAILVNRTNSDDIVDVDCINWSTKSQSWVTWNKNTKGKKIHMLFEPDDWIVYTMSGELTPEVAEANTKSSNMYISPVLK